MFKPYVGPKYGRSNPYGGRLLVLGESHYVGESGVRRASLTELVVQEYLAGEYASRFLTMVGQLIHGSRDICDEDKKAVWQSIAFYNYIQSSVGRRPRMRPRAKQWDAAQTPFLAVLRVLRPAGIVVLGDELWTKLPPAERGPVLRAGRSKVLTKRYAWSSRGEGAIAVGVRHPAGQGFKFRKYAPMVAALLQHIRRG
ncbi:MAG: hypothetical protein HY812_21455 [Planctomycetes bacterium]|nr:hypothetical protein [Planctomycetota bacterium]